MASKEAIELANNNMSTPGFIFMKSTFYAGSVDLIENILSGSSTKFGELTEAVTALSNYRDRLSLELEAFNYWVEKNKALIDVWESLGDDSQDHLNWKAAMKINGDIERLLSKVTKLFELINNDLKVVLK